LRQGGPAHRRRGERTDITRSFRGNCALQRRGLHNTNRLGWGAEIHWRQAAGNPTPRAISVAIKGIEAKPASSILMIQLKRLANTSVT